MSAAMNPIKETGKPVLIPGIPSARRCCGTLSYIAECRAGCLKKANLRPLRHVLGALDRVSKMQAIG